MAAGNSQAAVRRRERWQEIVRRWQASGTSQAEFCRRRGIPLWKLAWWKRRLGSQGALPAASFLPVQVMASSVGELELTLRGGRVLRFGVEVEPAKLAGIVAALETVVREDEAC